MLFRSNVPSSNIVNWYSLYAALPVPSTFSDASSYGMSPSAFLPCTPFTLLLVLGSFTIAAETAFAGIILKSIKL